MSKPAEKLQSDRVELKFSGFGALLQRKIRFNRTGWN